MAAPKADKAADKPDDEAVAPKAKKAAEPDRSALHDELEALKANGNQDPARLAEIKKLLA